MLAILALILGYFDARLIVSLLRPPSPKFDLVLDLPEGVLDRFGEPLILPSAPVLSPSGKDWLLDGRPVPNLTKEIARMKAINHRVGDVSNFTVSLGQRATFGRAIAAFTRIASEGTCAAAIARAPDKTPNELDLIAYYRDAQGRQVACNPTAYTKSYRE